MPRFQSTKPPTSLALALVLSSIIASSSSAANESEGRQGSDQWVPSLSFSLGFTTQSQDGASSSRSVGPGPVPRPPAEGSQYMTSPQFSGTLEIMSPSVPLPLSPRFFVSGEIASVSSQTRRLALEGDPTGLKEPDAAQFPEEAIGGQGSFVESDVQNVLYGASVGISIPFDVAGWELSVRPSARYLHRRVRFNGAVLDAIRPNINGPTRAIELRASDSLDVDAVGPALEIELNSFRFGSFGTSVFLSGGAYRVLSDRSIEFRAVGPDSLNQGIFEASFSADLDPWIYRADAGVRIRWIGAPSGWLPLP